jgi:hypothetical protein
MLISWTIDSTNNQHKENTARNPDLESQNVPLQQAASEIVTLKAGQHLTGTNFVLDGKSCRFYQWSSYKSYDGTGVGRRVIRENSWKFFEKAVKLAPSDILRWQLASRAISEYGYPEPTGKDCDWLVLEAKTPLRPPWSSRNTSLTICLAAVLYGGIHAFAWSYSFPTGSEQWLWRLSVLGMVFPILSWISFQFFNSYRKRDSIFHAYLMVTIILFPFALAAFGILLVSAFFWVAYPLMRGFFVVESLRDVFYLPEEAWKVPVWTCYIPHLGGC